MILKRIFVFAILLKKYSWLQSLANVSCIGVESCKLVISWQRECCGDKGPCSSCEPEGAAKESEQVSKWSNDAKDNSDEVTVPEGCNPIAKSEGECFNLGSAGK